MSRCELSTVIGNHADLIQKLCSTGKRLEDALFVASSQARVYISTDAFMDWCQSEIDRGDFYIYAVDTTMWLAFTTVPVLSFVSIFINNSFNAAIFSSCMVGAFILRTAVVTLLEKRQGRLLNMRFLM